MLLAQNFCKQPGLADKILGGYQNQQQIFAEPSLLSRLEAGQIDASSGYLSAATSHHLPFITLPDEINLSNPDMDAKWYKTVQFTITLPSGKEGQYCSHPNSSRPGQLGKSRSGWLRKRGRLLSRPCSLLGELV
jgi:molybdate/tungstate transport system substrate-binding protein